MKKRKKVTIQDIADDVGVSKSLVSLALSDKYGVSESTRSKIVLRAIEMGYKIPSKKTNNILFNVIISDIQIMRESFWSKIMTGIEKSMTNYKISINITIWNKQADAMEFVNQTLKNKPSGAIVISEFDHEIMEITKQLNVPIVLIDIRHPIGMVYDHVCANNFEGAFEGAKYLHNKGHHHIGFVGYEEYSHSFTERHLGVKRYASIHSDVKLTNITSIYKSKHDVFNPDELIKVLQEKDRPTALFCANDPIAIDVYGVVESLGLSIPQDISILGFDNIQTAEYLYPTLTSINIPKETIGEEAVRLLMQRMKNPNLVIKKLQLATSIIERNSVEDLTKNHI